MAIGDQAPSLVDMLDGSGPQRQGQDWMSLIAAPPEGWVSNKATYDQAGLGGGWLTGNQGGLVENPAAYAHTQAQQMPHGLDPFSDVFYNGPGARADTNVYGGPGSRGAAPGGGQGPIPQTSGFHLGSKDGPDLFGGRLFRDDNFPKNIPEQLQPLLAPSLMRYFYGNDYVSQGGSGITAPWTRKYAPTAPDYGQNPPWPGTAKYDPWHRPVGAQAIYS